MYDAFRRACAEDPSFAALYPDVDIGTVFDSWVQNPGAPVVNVDVNMSTGTINITQVLHICIINMIFLVVCYNKVLIEIEVTKLVNDRKFQVYFLKGTISQGIINDK